MKKTIMVVTLLISCLASAEEGSGGGGGINFSSKANGSISMLVDRPFESLAHAESERIVIFIDKNRYQRLKIRASVFKTIQFNDWRIVLEAGRLVCVDMAIELRSK